MKKLIYAPALLAFCLFSSTVIAQTCEEDLTTLTPDSRYVLLNSGKEVKDKNTGLIWQRCLVGEQWNGQNCTGDFEYFSIEKIKTYLNQNITVWRLPTIDELLTLKSVTCWAPSINTTIFPPAPERYGDSDTLLSSSIYKPTKQEERLALGYKWNWAFSTGYGQKSFESNGRGMQVRLVR
ncbi:DUF1566 domain-containing protein [Acinetobacter sp. Ac_5812]|uniref:Lcl C-terminal domain-containing protein n=1 Tax=Acinetobacter sp. Ac_5812 TaxID=1848937 RepID=UPI00148F6E5E|nr:DUF1566 domain-containing protein [Acinetobacter sp. Ac_5812]NNP67197.1 hypothetical protein [Acinetobacter sp. Ac_5812]